MTHQIVSPGKYWKLFSATLIKFICCCCGGGIVVTGEIRLLGVQIDDKLNFISHISELCIKASQKCGVLVRFCNLIPCNAKLSLNKSSILPYLTYCHLVWHFCNASVRRKLEWIQERALRAVYKPDQRPIKNCLTAPNYRRHTIGASKTMPH